MTTPPIGAVQQNTTDTPPPAAPDLTTPEGRAANMAQVALANPGQVPDKFKNKDGSINGDALLQSYLHLERAQSGAPAPPPAPEDTATQDMATALADPHAGTEAPQSLSEALADPPAPEPNELWDRANKEFEETGSLTPATVEALTNLGVPSSMIAAAVQGQQAKQASDMARAKEMVGGEEEFNSTIAWARENLSAQEKEGLIPLLRGPQAETVLMGLHSRRIAAEPRPSGQVNTAASANPAFAPDPLANTQPFSSWVEQEAATRDPRMKTDPAYRRSVEARLIAGAGMDPRQLR